MGLNNTTKKVDDIKFEELQSVLQAVLAELIKIKEQLQLLTEEDLD